MFLHSSDLHVTLSLSRRNDPDFPAAVNFNERKHDGSFF